MPASPTPGGGYLEKVVSGRANPRASLFFRLAPYTGPWGYLHGGADGKGAFCPLQCLICFFRANRGACLTICSKSCYEGVGLKTLKSNATDYTGDSEVPFTQYPNSLWVSAKTDLI